MIFVDDYTEAGDADDTAAFARAVAAVAALGGGDALCGPRLYVISDTITLGDGSASSHSTINGVRLKGIGAPFLRLDSEGGPLEDNGTRLKWFGPDGGVMLRVAGPCQGNDAQNIALNGNGLAAIGLDVLSGNRGEFVGITGANMRAGGVVIRESTVNAEAIGGLTEAIGSEGNLFRNTRAVCSAPNTIAIDLGGYSGAVADGWDTVRSRFENTYLMVNRAGGTGVRLGFTDQVTFADLYVTGTGQANGGQASVRVVGTPTVPSAHAFPQNIRFEGNLDLGQDLPVVVSGAPGGGHIMNAMTLFDQQRPPAWPANKYLLARLVTPGTFPKGGFHTVSGLMAPEIANRQKLRNAEFRNAALGTSFVNPGQGSITFDDWWFAYDGSVSFTVERVPFPLGDLGVPYEPEHYLRITVNSATGGSYFYLAQTIPSVRLFEGRQACFSLFAKCNVGINLAARVEQIFGTGGSPTSASASVARPVGSDWAHVEMPVPVPSIAGKLSGASHRQRLLLRLPVNTLMQLCIALPQFEEGPVGTRFYREALPAATIL